MYPWDDVALQIKTVRSDYAIWVGARTKGGVAIGQLKIQDGKYAVSDCVDGRVLKNLPEAPDNVRIWTIVKNGAQGFTIECNGVMVTEFLFSDFIKRTGCAKSKWLTIMKKTEKIVFNPEWDKSKAYRGSFCFRRGR